LNFRDILAFRDQNKPFTEEQIKKLEKYYIEAYGSLTPFDEETKCDSASDVLPVRLADSKSAPLKPLSVYCLPLEVIQKRL